jgi:hypothetical protein
MSAAEREKALFQIAATADPSISERAGIRLVSDDLGNSGEVAKLIASLVTSWSDDGRRAIVHRIATKVRPAPPFVELVRSLLRRELQTDGSTSAASMVETGAVLLAVNGVAEDQQLIRQALRRYADSAPLWYAIAASGGATGREIEQAKERYRDPARSMWLRVAAATGAANSDDQAAKFVLEQVEKTLADLADKDELTLYGDAQESEELLDRQRAVSVQLESLPAMRFFSAPGMEPLVKRGIGARNEFIRMAAAVSAAMRYPELLLSGKPSLVSETDYERLLAVLAMRSPQLAAKVESALGRSLSLEAKERARSAGLGGFGRAGSFVNAL